MRRLHWKNSLLALLALAAASFAAVPARAGALTKEQAADGWINLFDGETLFGLTNIGDTTWRVDGGNLVCDQGTGGWIATSSQFADFELVAKVRVAKGMSSGLVVRSALKGHPTENGSALVPLTGADDDAWHEIKVMAKRDKVDASVDGKATEGSKSIRPRGNIGVLFHTTHKNPKNKVEISELRLRPVGGLPIFNGNSLDDWSVIPGHKSVFSVDDGAIHIKNGNGQIESKSTYKDFCLQLDIFSNGDHLNSGVFFRTPVGVFWKGYECQVRNQWIGDDRTKAVDFGTGGNYGNQPARKVVSSDREWFKMTIVADGNHTSVWVNGYQASDYTDTRPVSPENDGKVGYVPGPGTINLQGHDPTTDLSFKNISIAAFPDK